MELRVRREYWALGLKLDVYMRERECEYDRLVWVGWARVGGLPEIMRGLVVVVVVGEKSIDVVVVGIERDCWRCCGHGIL